MSVKYNNMSIAEFMEFHEIMLDGESKYEVEYIQNMNPDIWFPLAQKFVFDEELLFHKSWDWLLPVVAKCTELATDLGMMDDVASKWYDIFDEEVSWGFLENKIQPVYDAVITFIKLINSQKPA